MATFIFDGTSNQTAAKTDTVVISANPALFRGVSEVNGNSVFTYTNGTTLTISNTLVAAGNYPNVSLANGLFSVASATTVNQSAANALVFAPTGNVDVSAGSVAGGVKAVFGGLGISDPTDGNDNITIGGAGSFLVYGNGGDDTILQNGAFDSTSFVTVFGGKNVSAVSTGDAITLTAAGNATSNAKMAIYGGEGIDTINVVNGGSNANTAIFGGQGAADPNDGNDAITFNGGGTVNIFGNAGDDTIILGSTNGGLASSTVATVYGGLGKDNISITVANAKATISVFGSENNPGANNEDSITVTGNTGTTVIYGGTAAADANDNADIISYTGQGTATIYAAGGNDSVSLFGGFGVTADSTSTTTVFGGNGNDSIGVFNSQTATGVSTLTLGAGSDVVTVGLSDAATVTATAAAAPTVVEVQNAGATSREIDTVAFKALIAGDTTTVGGLTFTANQDLTATQVASAYSGLTSGVSTGPATALGTYGGTLTGFTSAATTSNVVTFTGTVDNVTTNITASTALGKNSVIGSGSGTVVITDFQVGAGNDTLNVSDGLATTTVTKFTIVDASAAQTLQSALNLATAGGAQSAGAVTGVIYDKSAYIVVSNDGNATFSASTDLAIKLTGVTDIAALQTATTLV